jgi:hypothetical protein
VIFPEFQGRLVVIQVAKVNKMVVRCAGDPVTYTNKGDHALCKYIFNNLAVAGI